MGDEVMGIYISALHRHEEMTGLDRAAIDGDPCDRNIGNLDHAKRDRQFGKEALK
jgi:hypothetical protein